jgi:glycosyltransferase involved in cell wall biosynthesis
VVSTDQGSDARELAGVGVVLIGGFDYGYPREKSIREGFERAGATVRECRYSDSTSFLGPKKLLVLPYLYWTLAREMARIRDQGDEPDILVVTKFDLLVLPLAAIYAWRLDARLVYDLFVSLHRTAAMRGVLWPFVKATYVLERLTYRLPDNHLVGTNQFIELYAEMYGIPRARFVRLPPGADEDRFYPRDVDKREHFTALYWGNFLPHHGVDVILEAAKELRDEDIEFVFLGSGPELERTQNHAETAELSNVSFEGFVTDEDLHHWIASSHVCLGVFSSDRRALASITNKVCESVASGKATVTERSPAIEEWFTHGEDIYLVQPEDPESLAEAILRLRGDPGLIERLEAGAVSVHEREFSAERIAELLTAALGNHDPEGA